MKFGPRETVLLVLLLALPISSYWLVFRPQNAEIELAKEEIAYKQDMLEKLRTETQKSADLERANQEIRNNIRTIENRLPTNREVDSIIRQVSDLAVDVGLQPPLVTTEEAVGAALYMEQPLDMIITGDFRSFYDFLKSLEKLPRITRIPSMRIQRSDKQNGHMRADFRLSIYFEEEGEG